MYGSQKFDWLHNPVKMEQSRRRSAKRRSRLRHRARVCRKRQISVAEYERRFDGWCALRKLYTDHVRRQRQRADRDSFSAMLADRAEAKAAERASRRAELDAAEIINGIGPHDEGLPRLRAKFPTDRTEA